ncbi:MAG: hypothetical protein ACPGJV_01445 [Bacteriovoracaceae bacterium]
MKASIFLALLFLSTLAQAATYKIAEFNQVKDINGRAMNSLHCGQQSVMYDDVCLAHAGEMTLVLHSYPKGRNVIRESNERIEPSKLVYNQDDLRPCTEDVILDLRLDYAESFDKKQCFEIYSDVYLVY